MKILFNCLNTKKGGAERVLSILANHFCKNNDVALMTIMNTKDSYEYDKSIKRYCIDKKDYSKSNRFFRLLVKLSPKRLFKMRKLIALEKPNVIISFLPEPSIRLMFLRKICKSIRDIPTIISIRNDPNVEYKNKFIRFIVKKLYNNIEGMVFQTKDAEKYFAAHRKSCILRLR